MDLVEETEGADRDAMSSDAATTAADAAPAADTAADEPTDGPAPAPAAEPPTDILEEKIRSLEDRLMRQTAEFQNYRRRTEQEKARMVEFGKAMVVQHLLDVVDDFERSLDAARVEPVDVDAQKPFAALREGVELVYTKLRDELARVGVEEIEAVGQPFDEEKHEALMRQPAADGQETGIVVGEIQKGYRMGDRVLRHAKVIVSA